MNEGLKNFGKKVEIGFKEFGKKADIGLKEFGKKADIGLKEFGKKADIGLKEFGQKIKTGIKAPHYKNEDALLHKSEGEDGKNALLHKSEGEDALLHKSKGEDINTLHKGEDEDKQVSKKMKVGFEDFNKKILITFHADKYKVSKKKFLLWFFLMALLLLLIIIAVIVVVSIIFTNGSSSGGSGNIVVVAAVDGECLNPISIYKNGACQTTCKYGATLNKQKCNKCPNPISVYMSDKCVTTCKYGATNNKQKCNQPPANAEAGDCPNQNSIYKNNECQVCEYGIADNGTTCKKLCGLYQTGTNENKICDPDNDGANCVTNTKILHNNAEGACTYNNDCMYKVNGATNYRITIDKEYCNNVCINYMKDGSVYFNTDYAKSNKLFTWTQYGGCVQHCKYGPALVPNTKPDTNNGSLMPAYKNSAITAPKCNVGCDYPGETNTVVNGAGLCASVTAVCGDKAKYKYNTDSRQNYYKVVASKTNFTRKGGAKTVTNQQTFIHGCNVVCENTNISANTAKLGICKTNCAANTNVYFASLDGYRCNCPDADGKYIGVYTQNNIRYCNSTCKNYDISKNNDVGGCECIYPDAYTYNQANKSCVLKPCSNTAHKIMAHSYDNGHHGTCLTKKYCTSCVNNNGTNCNEKLPNASSICQSWNDTGDCIWTRKPVSKGFHTTNACGSWNGLQVGKHGGRVKYIKSHQHYRSVTHCCGGTTNNCPNNNYNCSNPHSFIDSYHIGNVNDYTMESACVATGVGCANCLTEPRLQCPA